MLRWRAVWQNCCKRPLHVTHSFQIPYWVMQDSCFMQTLHWISASALYLNSSMTRQQKSSSCKKHDRFLVPNSLNFEWLYCFPLQWERCSDASEDNSECCSTLPLLRRHAQVMSHPSFMMSNTVFWLKMLSILKHDPLAMVRAAAQISPNLLCLFSASVFLQPMRVSVLYKSWWQRLCIAETWSQRISFLLQRIWTQTWRLQTLVCLYFISLARLSQRLSGPPTM